MKIKPKCVCNLNAVSFYSPRVNFNLFKIKFNFIGPRSIGARGYRSATQESLRSTVSALGPSIKYVTLFLINFYPPVTLCHTSRDPPKYVTHLGPPRFLVGLVQKSRTKAPCTNSLSIVRGGFCPKAFSAA